jgi:hypothetical protein
MTENEQFIELAWRLAALKRELKRLEASTWTPSHRELILHLRREIEQVSRQLKAAKKELPRLPGF